MKGGMAFSLSLRGPDVLAARRLTGEISRALREAALFVKAELTGSRPALVSAARRLVPPGRGRQGRSLLVRVEKLFMARFTQRMGRVRG